MIEERTPEPANEVHISAAFSPRRRAVMLFVLFLVSTASYLDRNVFAVALEPIKNEFHASDTVLGALSGAAFAVFYVTLGIPVARLADRGDRRLVVTCALAVWSVMTVACGLASKLWQLGLARIGVGAGESGAMAPAQSLIADYFPLHQRARAIGVFMMSATAGNFFGFAVGGWVTQSFGWRAMFLAAGIPSLLLAPIAYVTLKEPRRMGAFRPVAANPETLLETLRYLSRKRSYICVVAAMAIFFFIAYGPVGFMVPFLMRVHHLSISQAGGLFGTLTAISGVTGNLVSGVLSDGLAKRDIRWFCKIPATGLLALGILYQGAFLTPSLAGAIGFLFLAGLFFGGAYPPMYSALHSVCGSQRRVMAFAIALFISNLIGLGLGPLTVGFLSDSLAQFVGPENGLRYALASVAWILVPAVLLFQRAGRHIADEVEA